MVKVHLHRLHVEFAVEHPAVEVFVGVHDVELLRVRLLEVGAELELLLDHYLLVANGHFLRGLNDDYW